MGHTPVAVHVACAFSAVNGAPQGPVGSVIAESGTDERRVYPICGLMGRPGLSPSEEGRPGFTAYLDGAACWLRESAPATCVGLTADAERGCPLDISAAA